MRPLAAFLLLLTSITTVLAEKAPPIVPDKGTIDPSIVLIGTKAKTAAVCERYNIVVAGAAEGTLQVFGLQADGTAASAPIQTLTLPLPPEFQSVSQAPVYLIFHPQLPLLYVWQDISTAFRAPFATGYENIAHLVIYKVNGQNLELVGSYAKGADFAYGQTLGSLALSQNLHRLLVPNCYSVAGQASGVGYYDLTDAGLPVIAAGKTDPDVTVLLCNNTFPTGAGIVTGPNGLAIAGCLYGVLFVDTDTSLALRMLLRDQLFYLAAANPKKPICYFSTSSWFILASVELADGYLTQLPHFLALNGVQFLSPPVVMTAKNQLAVGGNNQLVIINLDENGWPLPKAQAITVMGTPTELAYSEKFNRLYVPVN